MVRRRGDNIPPVSDYAHWNEDQYYMWYEENKYDMMYADEILDDWEDNGRYFDEPDPDIDLEFDTQEEAEAYFQANKDNIQSWSVHQHTWHDGKTSWFAEGFTTEYAKKCQERYYKSRRDSEY